MIRALWTLALATLLALGGCASSSTGESGDESAGGYERSGGY